MLIYSTTQLNNKFQSGKIGVVISDMEIEENLTYTFQDNVTINFHNGKFIGQGVTLIGNNTKIDAPICQIFGDGISLQGTWITERAYPQWFGCVTYNGAQSYSTGSSNNIVDAAPFINKAINMKGNGEVFLPHGFYILKTEVLIPVGISLVGEKGQVIGSDANNRFFNGTVLQSWKENNTEQITDESDKYMLYFNSDTSFQRLYGDGTDFLAGQISEIKNLTLYNCVPTLSFDNETDEEKALRLMSETTACIKGIYAADTLSIENVRFEYIRQAVVFAGDRYIDSKRIVNCAVSTIYEKQFKYLNHDIYSFDMGFIGDDLLFEHNTLEVNCHKGLHVNHCGGGRISCNIINADVLIEKSKAITFCNNHIEEGHQVDVLSSNVTFEGNFFEKRFKPSIRIRGNKWNNKSVVTLIDESFLFYESGRLIDSPEYKEARDSLPVGNQFPLGFSDPVDYRNFLALKGVFESISEYDIDIDIMTDIKLSNVLRYRIMDSIDSIQPTGISMRKITYSYDDDDNVIGETINAFSEFNNYSYELSKDGHVTPGFNVVKNFVANGIKEDFSIISMADENNDSTWRWMAMTGTCVYHYQVIWDKLRPLVGNLNGQQLKATSQINVTMGSHNCVLLVLSSPTPLNGNNKLLRLFRTITLGDVINNSYVDIPLCCSEILYDNGVSINGYKWVELPDNWSNYSLSGDSGLETIKFEGENVQCRTSTVASNFVFDVSLTNLTG